MAPRNCQLVIVLLMFLSVKLTTSISCYSCTSNREQACTDPFNNNTIVASYCDLTTSVCVKQVLPALGTIKESTFRGCVSEEYCKLFSNKSKHCTTCKDNYCNSSTVIFPSYMSLLIPVSYYVHKYLFR